MAIEWKVQAPHERAEFGLWVRWPDDLAWSTQLWRLFGYAGLGVADVSEVLSVVDRLQPGEEAGWHDGFAGLGARLEARAGEAAEVGHAGTAVRLWDRAAVYHRLAATWRSMAGEVDVPVIEDSRRCFLAARRADPTAKHDLLEIPYEGTSLPAHFLTPRPR